MVQLLKKSLKNKTLSFLTLGVLLFTFSCKKQEPLKDELIGDKSIFVGKWDWVYSDHYFGWCDGENWEETLTTMTEGIAFSIKFIENGTLFFYRNGSLISEYRIKMKIFEPGNNCGINVSYEFHIDLDNIDELNFGGCLNSDTLITGGFPGFHFQPEQGCESYTNYFIKN